MRRHYTAVAEAKGRTLNECTLRTKVTDIKKLAMHAVPKSDQRNTHPTYDEGIKRLQRARDDTDSAACGRNVDEFLAKHPFLQLKDVSRNNTSRGRKSLCEQFDDPRVQKAFTALRIVPENFESFHITLSETERCKKAEETRLLRKKVIVIPDSRKMHRHAGNVLARPTEWNIHEVIAALCFASGRRTTELLNGHSVFTPLEHVHAHACVFQGQLKTAQHVNEMPYKIPLLVPYEDFDRGLRTVRAWQSSADTVDPLAEIKALTNKQVSNRYQPNLQRHLKANLFGGVRVRPHMLRAIYVRYVLLVFDWGDETDRRIAKYCLGHASSKQQQHYDHIKLRKVGPMERIFGVFPLSEEELRKVEAVTAGDGVASDVESDS